MRLKPLTRQALAVGVVLTLLQLALAFWLAPIHRTSDVYARLCAWDCGWYSSIVKEGYHSTVPPAPQNAGSSNVAFFPGFPYLARAVHLGTGLKAEITLVLIAQFFTILFWASLWRILRGWKISVQGSLLVVLAILAHPAAIFLIAGYSESLFLSTLLVFILSSRSFSYDDQGSSAKSYGGVCSAVSGMTMSATRIVGMPVSLFPLMTGLSTQILQRKRPPSTKLLTRAALVSALASLGAVGFLVYCWYRWGRYDLYMETQRIGWGIQPDYAAIFKWKEFNYYFGFDRMATILSGVAFLAFAAIESVLLILRKNRGLATRAPIYAVSLLIFYITLGGLKSLGFRSMIRYTLPWHVLLLLCLAHLISRHIRHSPTLLKLALIFGVIAAGFAMRYLSVPHIVDYLNGRWFA
jgi:hypothetical protein